MTSVQSYIFFGNITMKGARKNDEGRGKTMKSDEGR